MKGYRFETVETVKAAVISHRINAREKESKKCTNNLNIAGHALWRPKKPIWKTIKYILQYLH